MGARLTGNAALTRAQALLASARTVESHTQLEAMTVELAGLLLTLARAAEGREEQKRRHLLRRMMADPRGQLFTTFLTDRAPRSRDTAHVVHQALHLLSALRTPAYLPFWDRARLFALRALGPLAPREIGALVLEKVAEEARAFVPSAADPELGAHLAARRRDGVRVNVNAVGEEILSEAQAAKKRNQYVELLRRPDVDTISLKISSVESQLSVLAFEQTVKVLILKIRPILEAARDQPGDKLVYFDMESYRDLHLTVETFQRLLSEPALAPVSAGLVLQAYLPDSHAVLERMLAWAEARVQGGGAPIRIRLVKGANLMMERFESDLHGLAVPVYPSKLEVDASYRRMLLAAVGAARSGAVRVGLASHNLFDVALGLLLRERHRLGDGIGFEQLEGMAESEWHVLRALHAPVLLYTPVVHDDELHSAVAYLVRRLDENTGAENFLRHSFAMAPGDATFDAQADFFRQGFQLRETLATTPRRQQDRAAVPAPPEASAPFENEPDTDFTQDHHRAWLEAELVARRDVEAPTLRSWIDGAPRGGDGPPLDGNDPSRPDVVPYRVAPCDGAALEHALETADAARSGWAARTADDRGRLLRAVAQALRRRRGELIAAMVADAGKRVVEADIEVSEAIDFVEYYARSGERLYADQELTVAPRGVVVVVPPWNFPLAIPVGGVAAALAAGNTAILKPALETALVGSLIHDICREAGVPDGALQLLLVQDADASPLIEDRRVSAVVLTGGTATAQLFLRQRPDLPLFAETGGKNAMIVTAMADREQAIQDILRSAFGHAGQKCSACSLLVCEAEVYDDPTFFAVLREAAASLEVGPAWDLAAVITPLIRPPEGPLLRALTSLDDGETWLLEPRLEGCDGKLYAPGIKVGVRPGSFMHQTELFGPVLGVMRAENLDHAIDLLNGTDYGLTAGLHSLDEREHGAFLARAQAGSLYINRGITGAVVHRQSFGGWKASSFGPGAKAGGPDYVAQLATVVAAPDARGSAAPRGTVSARVAELVAAARDRLDDDDVETLVARALEYARVWHDGTFDDELRSDIVGQENRARYVPVQEVLVRVAPGAAPVDVWSLIVAQATLGLQPRLSLAVDALSGNLGGLVRFQVETAAAALARLEARAVERLLVLGKEEPELVAGARRAGLWVTAEPVSALGRLELRRLLREQIVSLNYHRYGNPARLPPRPEPLPELP